MKTTAALLVELGKPLEIVDLDILPLKPGQTLIEIVYSGVCHTQVLEARGYRGEDKFLPHCLGHEGSGNVVEVGPGVSKVKPGDRVILSWIKGSGADVAGSLYDWAGREPTLRFLPVSATNPPSLISRNRRMVSVNAAIMIDLSGQVVADMWSSSQSR